MENRPARRICGRRNGEGFPVAATGKSNRRRELFWLLAGFAVAIALAFVPARKGIPLAAGIAAWWVNAALVFILPVNRFGARVAAFLAGLYLVVPAFVAATPFARGMLAAFGCLPFAAAAAFVMRAPMPSVRARFAYVFTWAGTRTVNRRECGFDASACLQLVSATAIAVAAMAAVKFATVSDLVLLRWFAAAVLMTAVGEMITAGPALAAAMFGMTVPPLFNSPYRSASINEFWTQRWNILTSQMLLRPLLYTPLARFSVAFAVAATFIFSGVGHALLTYLMLGNWKLSWLCGGFFFVQPVFIAIERRVNVRRWSKAAARAWTVTALALTSPLLTEPALRALEQSLGPPDSVFPSVLALFAGVVVGSVILALGTLAARPAATIARNEASLALR
jgi:hypothetical protein